MNKIIGLSITLVVGIILTSSVLMPVITSAQDDVEIEYNNASYYVSLLSDGDTTGELVVSTGDYVLNGRSISLPSSGVNQCIFAVDGAYIQYKTLAATASLVIPSDDSFEVVSNFSNVAFSFADGVASITYTVSGVDSTITIPSSWALVADPTGDYSFIEAGENKTVYINSIDDIYSIGWVSTTSQPFFIEDGNVSLYGEGISNTKLVADLTLVDGLEDLYAIEYTSSSGLFFEIDNGGESYTVHPYSIFVPKSVIGHEEGGKAYVALLAAIPIMVILALVILAARASRY